MLAECYYTPKNRFYGLFIQLPGSFFVTAIILLPAIYLAEETTQILLMHLLIYWAAIMAFFWFIKDKYVQKILQEFSFTHEAIYVKKNNDVNKRYEWSQIDRVRQINKESHLARLSLSCEGVSITFDDGFELVIMRKITNYDLFSALLEKNMLRA